MNASLRCLGLVLVSVAATWLGGCTSTVQIVRAPLVVPVVVPAPEAFVLRAGVKNFSETKSSPSLWFKVDAEYTSTPGGFTCRYRDHKLIGVLAPGAGWGLSDYPIGYGNCPCVKDSCVGLVRLTLSEYPDYNITIPGENTALSVTWTANGSLFQMKVDTLP